MNGARTTTKTIIPRRKATTVTVIPLTKEVVYWLLSDELIAKLRRTTFRPGSTFDFNLGGCEFRLSTHECRWLDLTRTDGDRCVVGHASSVDYGDAWMMFTWRAHAGVGYVAPTKEALANAPASATAWELPAGPSA